MNGALSAPLSQYTCRESKLIGISSRKLSQINSKQDNTTLASQKPRTDRKEFDDFDKCVVGRKINDI